MRIGGCSIRLILKHVTDGGCPIRCRLDRAGNRPRLTWPGRVLRRHRPVEFYSVVTDRLLPKYILLFLDRSFK